MSGSEIFSSEIATTAQPLVVQELPENVSGPSGCVALDMDRIIFPADHVNGIDLNGKLLPSSEATVFERTCACGVIGRICVVNGLAGSGSREGHCTRNDNL